MLADAVEFESLLELCLSVQFLRGIVDLILGE